MKPLQKKAWVVMCVVLLCIALSFAGCRKENLRQSTSSTTDSESVATSSEESESGNDSIDTSSEESESDSGETQNSSSGDTWTGTYLPT